MSFQFFPILFSSLFVLEASEPKKQVPSTICICDCKKDIDYTFCLFVDGQYEDYLQFVSNQEERVSWEDFLKIQNRIKNLIAFEGERLNQKLRTWIPRITQFLIDKDIELRSSSSLEAFELIWKDYLNENFKALSFPIELKPLLLASYQLVKLDIFITLASGPKTMTEFSLALKDISTNKLDLAFFVYILKVVHSEQSTCFKFYDCKTYVLLERVRELILKESESGKQELYQHYLNYRSEKLGLDSKSPLNHVLTRIGSILQLNTIEEGKILKESLLQLNPDDLALVVDEFSLTKVSLDFVFPRTLVEFLNKIQRSSIMGKTPQDRLYNLVKVGVPLVAKILKQQRVMIMKKEIDASTQIILKSEEGILPQDLTKWADIGFELKKDGALFIR